MPIVLNGSGTVTGISVGGLPDGIIQSADLATGVGGKILQVKQAVKTDVSSRGGSSGQDAFAAISGLSVDITPSATSSKILVLVNIKQGQTSNCWARYQLQRDSTAIYVCLLYTSDAADE